MRIFLDANILFSAAKSDGAIRQLLRNLTLANHTLVADSYVQAEASRNIAAKADARAVTYLDTLLSQIEVNTVQFAQSSPTLQAAALWLPEKDRPVLLAAMALVCDVLVTGDSTHFGQGYGKRFEGVMVCSPRQLAELI
jgi:predicted nucleic acid-binding protein